MLEILVAIGRKCTGASDRPRWLRQVKELIGGNFAARLSLSQIAAEVGLNPVYLSAAFRKHCGCTIGDYIRRVRVEHASRELAHGDAPLADIGLSVGFSDQAHFSRTFKRFTGMTPAQFRAAARG
jgi:AraC family transcriptional regulator